jgi:hypothetical protein
MSEPPFDGFLFILGILPRNYRSSGMNELRHPDRARSSPDATGALRGISANRPPWRGGM